MDFWQRLIAGTSFSPAGNKASLNNPDKRLQRFKREYNQLLVSIHDVPDHWAGHAEAFQQIWRSTANLSKDPDAADAVRNSIQEITSMLSDETRRPSPHVCISFAATKQIYLPIGKIATTSYNEAIIREAVAFFSTLIDSEEEDFMENAQFSHSLITLLIRITGANSIHLGSEAEVEVVELAFGIAAKIRLHPDILPAWFRETHQDRKGPLHVNSHDKFTGKTHREDFPLFYLLIDYIHHEGRVGDFARTGLLYIIESASTSLPLEQWIVESDLATLMATGLGALYSQLSRKLVIDYPPEQLPPILALSDYQHPISTSEIISSASLDFKGHMETFLSHLMFWQDVLEHCKSVEVKQTLLEHFQVIFLQQLLYPSLLESSDLDGEISGGGSSVAVLTYLRRVLEALEHPDMIHMILQYLLALPETKTPKYLGERGSVSAALQRKSMDLQSMLAAQSSLASTPAIYNLVDLVIGTLQSENQQTVGATLQLVSVMLKRHHRYAAGSLLKISSVKPEVHARTIGMHEAEMEFLMTLVEDMGVEDGLEDAYENHIKDGMTLLEHHMCSQELILPKSAEGIPKSLEVLTSIPGAPEAVTAHSLRSDDPILRTMIGILSNFYTNPVEINLALTETFVDLASCGFMHLSGWMLPDPSMYSYEDLKDNEGGDKKSGLSANTPTPASDSGSDDSRGAMKRAYTQPIFPPASFPAFLHTLQKLVRQASLYRTQIPRFDDLLSQRRLGLSEDPAPRPAPIRHQPPRSSMDSESSRASSPQPAQRSTTLDSLAFRMFSDFHPKSRSSSPSSQRSRDGLRNPGVNPSTPSSKQQPSGFAPGLSESKRPQSTPNHGRNRSYSGSPLKEGGGSLGVEESQARAFREVDRGILARRVGPPMEEPVPFPNLRELETDGSTNDGKVEGENDEVVDEREERIRKQIEEAENGRTVSVSHVLTNVIVLQEFLLEITALVQVRAGLFGRVAYA